MLIAEWNGERLDAEYDWGDDLVCPVCKWGVVRKAGRVKVAHYAHRPGAECSHGVGESAAHMELKTKLAEQLGGQVEVPIGGRIADVLVGDEVYEVQLSSMTVEGLYERRYGTRRVNWILPVKRRDPREGENTWKGSAVKVSALMREMMDPVTSPPYTNMLFTELGEVFEADVWPIKIYKSIDWCPEMGSTYVAVDSKIYGQMKRRRTIVR